VDLDAPCRDVTTRANSAQPCINARMVHREETTWTIRIEATAEFEEDYDGELDGFAWRDVLFRDLQRRVAAVVLRELASSPGWKVHTANAGLAATDELLVRLDVMT